MKKRLYAIWSVLLVLVISIAVLVPGCITEEREQDASIEFSQWIQNDDPIGVPPSLQVVPCERVGVLFQQYVDGVEGHVATIHETSWLRITQIQGAAAQIVVVNDWCAVNKTPEPSGKVFQWPTINGTPVEAGMNITLPAQQAVDLDVTTGWELEKLIQYTKAINWLGISTVAQFEQSGPHPCVLFELVVPGPGAYTFTLQASAEVVLMGDTDVNPNNNSSGWSNPLTLTVVAPP